MTQEQREAIAPEDLEKTRWLYVQKILEQLIETKMKYADATSNIPKERLPDIKTSVNESFEKTRLKSLLEKYKAANRSELESKMAAAGQSLERQRQLYFEAAMAASWENQHVSRHKEIPVSQVLGYYQQHIADFEFPARARWEQLMVNFEHYSSRPEAYRALCDMGNEVLRGADFAAVAKARSHGPTAISGGQYDWTGRGSLVSKEIDAAIFSLPVGSMSQPIEDAKGFHIVRVIERTDAGRKPFLEAQVEIRDKLREESITAQKDEFLAKIKQRTPVWTVFGDAIEGAAGGESVGNRGTDSAAVNGLLGTSVLGRLEFGPQAFRCLNSWSARLRYSLPQHRAQGSPERRSRCTADRRAFGHRSSWRPAADRYLLPLRLRPVKAPRNRGPAGGAAHRLHAPQRASRQGERVSYRRVRRRRSDCAVLTETLGILVVVVKRREISLHHNVRIHLDEVQRLGSFLEFEAVLSDTVDAEAGRQQIAWLRDQFAITDVDLVRTSYSDLILHDHGPLTTDH